MFASEILSFSLIFALERFFLPLLLSPSPSPRIFLSTQSLQAEVKSKWWNKYFLVIMTDLIKFVVHKQYKQKMSRKDKLFLGSFYRMAERNTRRNAEPELLTTPAFTQLWCRCVDFTEYIWAYDCFWGRKLLFMRKESEPKSEASLSNIAASGIRVIIRRVLESFPCVKAADVSDFRKFSKRVKSLRYELKFIESFQNMFDI